MHNSSHLVNAVSDFLAQAPEVRVEEVCGGIALSEIDRACIDWSEPRGPACRLA